MKRKFAVFKLEDIEKYIPNTGFGALNHVAIHIYSGRILDGRKVNNEYLVINCDESYADEVIEIMKRNGHWDE